MARGRRKAARTGVKSLPPRRTGSSKVTPNGSYPMAHGGNC